MIPEIVNPYFQSLLVLFISIILAKAVQLLSTRYLKRIAEGTKTQLDDVILKVITKPVFIFIILIGLNISLKLLPELIPYQNLLDMAFFILYSLGIAWIVSRLMSFFISGWLRVKKQYEKTPQLITKIISLIIYLLAILIILDHFQIEITPLVATLGLGGLAVGLALQSTLSDFFAGLHILSDKTLAVGDFVTLENGISGYIEDIGWRSTKIRTLPNTLVIIPNTKLADSIVTDESKPQKEMSVVVQCGVDYGSDLEKVEKITIKVAEKIQKTVPGAVRDFKPFIRYHTFGDSNINFSVILRVQEPVARYLAVHEFIKALKKQFDKEGIEISWPVRKVYLKK